MGALVHALEPLAQAGIAIIGLEPSCLLTLRDEALTIGLGPSAHTVAAKAVLLEEFIAAEANAGRFGLAFKPSAKPVLVHGHCHQKAFDTVGALMKVLAMVPGTQARLIETSCCGMAGAFGYQARHYATSMQMAELSLLPAIRKDENAWVIADGTSCRHQIQDGTQQEATHLAILLAAHLPG
jgi:Fe-S oxidoreductase